MWKYLDRAERNSVTVIIVLGLVLLPVVMFGEGEKLSVQLGLCLWAVNAFILLRWHRESHRRAFLLVLSNAAKMCDELNINEIATFESSSHYFAVHRQIGHYIDIMRHHNRMVNLIPRLRERPWHMSIEQYRAALEILRIYFLMSGVRHGAARDELSVKPEYRRAFRLIERRIVEADRVLAKEHQPRPRPQPRPQPLNEREEIERRSRENYARFLDEQAQNPRPPLR